MSKKFVRNITGTNLGGSKLNKNSKKVEPLDTNMQNDLLSDDTDVFVRNGDVYHCLTDNVKTVQSNDSIINVETIDKNTVEIDSTISTKTQAETGVNNQSIMTPLQTKHAINFQVPTIVDGKIAEIPQVDWNETDEESKSFIRNKPEINNELETLLDIITSFTYDLKYINDGNDGIKLKGWIRFNRYSLIKDIFASYSLVVYVSGNTSVPIMTNPIESLVVPRMEFNEVISSELTNEVQNDRIDNLNLILIKKDNKKIYIPMKVMYYSDLTDTSE